ncbi:hypothetical protein RhiirA5_421853 [Rhizophagus irregularis]|uniref:Uncharacterized protein n=2 Tax=Rhizophagus irregularis TaxID=588596 RepID=A0A2N0PD22_9GLOM|nr:hypothetical protein RhiirA5_421853 [Rhizophagus irregularis]PKC73755.1 hypothetical protein RhiirA1_450810 [Rhizophagus irregularis]PKK75789.1 hypothetical protein RhiirC2_773223 [Rhizophagus irregularis]GBC34834.1 hypothetical protein GLOIN_2v1875369 [Rhizophagus irregularis DAOM 181602=DAOM 197198]
MVDYKDIELAQVKVIKTALQKGRKYDNFAKNYEDYLKKLLKELYKVYYYTAKEKNCERLDDKIEQMFKAMAI